VALAALEKLAKRGVVKKSDRVIVVSTANGLKFTEFKVRYHERAIAGVAAAHANPPMELPPEYDRVLAALDAHAKSRAAG
jgi:threonine synthase